MDFEALKKYAVFNGRASRKEYWHFILLNLVLIVLATIADLTGTLGAIVTLTLLLPSLAVSVRRLHDIDKSGWWYLVILVPLVGIIIVLFWFCTRGTQGANRFGTDPLLFVSVSVSKPYPKNIRPNQNLSDITDSIERVIQNQKSKDVEMIGEKSFQFEKDNKRNGEDTYTWTNGTTYIGEWKNDRMHGQGNLTYADGGQYIGAFKNGKSNGQGTFFWASGAQHTGEWTDGKQNGQGSHTYADGTLINGIWKNGISKSISQ